MAQCLPDDVLGVLADHLPGITLKQFCLTSKVLHSLSQPLLFSYLVIDSVSSRACDDETSRLSQVWRGLRQTPRFGYYVKRLVLRDTGSRSYEHWLTMLRDPSAERLHFILKTLINVVSFSITRDAIRSFGSMSVLLMDPSVTLGLQAILSVPSLKRLDFSPGFTFPKPSDFLDLLQIKEQSQIESLALSGVSFLYPSTEHRDPAQTHVHIKHLTLCHLHDEDEMFGGPHASRTITTLLSSSSSFNLRNLLSLTVVGLSPEDGLWISELLDAQANPSLLHDISFREIQFIEPPNQTDVILSGLERFTAIQTLTISFDGYSHVESITHIDSVSTTEVGVLVGWLRALPITPRVENLILYASSQMVETRDVTTWRSRFDGFPGMDAFIDGAAMPKLKSLVVNVDKSILEVYGVAKFEIQQQIIEEILPKAASCGLLTVCFV
ncbi:hypothetical protein DL96DRAFT_1581641 [Flagelloscypha sp. PMI_526]|nr:hypothetical protein DL96DRAFT_1581641 [Flagelloscypha sp. PMI_526]